MKRIICQAKWCRKTATTIVEEQVADWRHNGDWLPINVYLCSDCFKQRYIKAK